MAEFVKYPRTPHLSGSRLQPGDVDDGIRLDALPAGLQVWEEKLDGANCGISFDEDGRMVLQSRGHPLTGGARERQFDIFKAWTQAHEPALGDILGTRYVMYCEWMAAKHSIFYNALPHLAFEEDIFDRERGVFLSTSARRALLGGSPVVSVPILHEGPLKSVKAIKAMIGPSLYQTTSWREDLAIAAEKSGVDPVEALGQTDPDGLSEGLYLKVEDPETNTVVGRYKWVRAGFVQTILGSGSHWSSRPIIGNMLTDGVDIYAAPTGPSPF